MNGKEGFAAALLIARHHRTGKWPETDEVDKAIESAKLFEDRLAAADKAEADAKAAAAAVTPPPAG